MGAMTLAASAVRRCPDSSLLASHWRQDGTCLHEPPSLALLVGEAKNQRLGLEIDVYPGSEAGYLRPRVTVVFYRPGGMRPIVKSIRASTVETATRNAWTWLQGRRR